MQRLRFIDVKDPLARVINVGTGDPRVLQLANESERRLVTKGRWLGTLQRFQICISAQGCISWPRQIDTIEQYFLCNTPGTIRTIWYEAGLNTWGLQDGQGTMNSHTLIDRGTLCVFDSIDTVTNLVMVQSLVPEAAGARILLRGYDVNNNWIRTQEPLNSGNWIDGAWVPLSTSPQFSPVSFAPGYSLTEVIKPVTNGPVTLWQYDTSIGTPTKQIAYYEADETLPIYRASIIPGLGNVHGCGTPCGSNNNQCQSNRVTVLAKLRHIDVVNDNDFFLLGNLGALKLMVMAILKEERNLFQESLAYEAKAIKELNQELSAYEGDGAVPTLKTESSATWGANVLNPVTLGVRIY